MLPILNKPTLILVYLATISLCLAERVVTNTSDSGSGSLRDAVTGASNFETIAFDPSLQGQTIVLSEPIRIWQHLTIDGSDRDITISGAGKTSHFYIEPSTTRVVTIRSLTLRDGMGRGNNGVVPGNRPGGGNDDAGAGGGGAGLGGSICSDGRLLILESIDFVGNQAIGGDGGHFDLEGREYVRFYPYGYSGRGGSSRLGFGGGMVEGYLAAEGERPNYGGLRGEFGGGGSGAAFGASYIEAPVTTESGEIILVGNFGPGGGGGFGGGGGGGNGLAGSVIHGGEYSESHPATLGGDGGSFGGAGGNGSFYKIDQVDDSFFWRPAGGGGGGGAGLGGAIFARGGRLVLRDCTFSACSAEGGHGGNGIPCVSEPHGDGPAIRSTDGADGQGVGGAIFLYAGTELLTENVQFQGNTAANDANDLYAMAGATTTTGTFSAILGEDDESGSGSIVITNPDPEANPSFDGTHPGAYGSVSVADGQWTYQLNNSQVQFLADNEVLEDAVTLTASDGSTALIEIRILGSNDAPVPEGSSRSISTDEDVPVLISAKGSDPEGDALSIVVVSSPQHGSVELTQDGQLLYTPEFNFFGTDSFVYRLSDGALESVTTAQVDLVVSPINDAPVPYATLWLDEDEPTEFGFGYDWEGGLTTEILEGPSHGELSLTQNGTYRYTPAPDFYGEDQIRFILSDGELSSAETTLQITVDPVEDAPRQQNLEKTIQEDTVTWLRIPKYDVDRDVLTVSIQKWPEHGLLQLMSGNHPEGDFLPLVYRPYENYAGPDSFVFTLGDGQDSSPASTYTLVVEAVNDPPVPRTASVSTQEDESVRLTLATDIDGPELSCEILRAPEHGQLTLLSGARYEYTPDDDFWGVDSFVFRATDSVDTTDAVTLSVGISPVGDTYANPDLEQTFQEDEAAYLRIPALDVDGDALTLEVIDGPEHGSLELLAGAHPEGDFLPLTYTPEENYYGTDGFTFRLNDGSGETRLATYSLQIEPVNDPPVTFAGSLATAEDQAAAVTLATDVDGPSLEIEILDAPAHGTLTLGVDGQHIYTPDDDFFGTDRFVFRASDSIVSTGAITVEVLVSPVEDTYANPDLEQTLQEDEAAYLRIPALDVDGDALTLEVIDGPAHGSLELLTGAHPEGDFLPLTYTPAENYHGADTFTFRMNDGKQNTREASYTLQIEPLNDAPFLLAGESLELAVSQDESVALPQGQDIEGDAIGHQIVNEPGHGSIFNGVYTPAPSFSGVDEFSFQFFDGQDLSQVYAVTVRVEEVSNAPVASGRSYAVDFQSETNFTLEGSDLDGGAVLTYAVIQAPANGRIEIHGNQASYLPSGDYVGYDSFTYQITDETGLKSNEAYCDLLVNGILDDGTGFINGAFIGPFGFLGQIDLTGLDLSKADFTGIASGNLWGSDYVLPAGWLLIDGYLVGPTANLSWAWMPGSDLSGADLRNATLQGANVAGANFSGVQLDGANLTGADLSGADLSGASGLDEADFTGATFSEVLLPEGYTVVDGALVPPAPSRNFQAWAREQGLPESVDGNARSASGQPLLLHFAMEVAPSEAIPAEHLPQMKRDAASGRAVFRYTVPKADRGVTLIPEISASPAGPWQAASSAAQFVEESTEYRVYELTPSTEEAAFFRVRIE